MSYDISLLDPVTKEVVEFDEPHQMASVVYRVIRRKHLYLYIPE